METMKRSSQNTDPWGTAIFTYLSLAKDMARETS